MRVPAVQHSGQPVAGQRSDVQCIFYCIFHHEAGPKIEVQEPADFIVKESFDKVSRYLITKTDFDNRFIWLDAFGSRIMGCAQCIEDKRYKRNAMHFNIGLVISMDCQVPVKYELIVRKLGRYFHSLEVETAFLSDPDAQTKLLPVLTSIRASLNGPGSCKLQVLPGRSLELFLKPAAPLEAAAMPQDFEVPVLVGRSPPVKTDIVTSLILPYIDGVSHVAKIACMADVDKSIVKTCLQNLCSLHAVRFLPLTLYSDSYACLTGLHRLVSDPRLGQLCQEAVTLSERPASGGLFRLFSCMSPGSTLKDLLTLHSGLAANVDVLRLVQFGLLHCLIRRVSAYPVRLHWSQTGSADCSVGLRGTDQLNRLLDGYRSMDEICASTGLSRQMVEERLERDSLVVVIRR
uniref:Nitrogen permease regulator 2-like protein n=1 Tax=Macrostomum lignano TaxID=282301 RepID=A0A1I8I0R2_9PLAT